MTGHYLLIHFVVVIHSSQDGIYSNQVIKKISCMQEIVQVITSLFECVKKENNDMISDIKDLS